MLSGGVKTAFRMNLLWGVPSEGFTDKRFQAHEGNHQRIPPIEVTIILSAGHAPIPFPAQLPGHGFFYYER